MKRALSLFLILIFAFSLCACNLDFSSQIESISDSIFNQVVDLGGGLLKEDTSSNSDYNYDHELLETDTATETETDTETETETEPDAPDTPDEPEVPTGPVLVLYERSKVALNNYISLNLTSDTHREGGRAHGGVRLYRDFDTIISDSNGYGYFYLNGIKPVVHLNEEIIVSSDADISSLARTLNQFAVNFGTNALFNVTHVEIGTNPDQTISAQDYARLLNACYDGANGTLGEGYGIAEINPSIKLISGQLSTIQTQYIKDVMAEIGNLRADGFLPIGGWSINYSTPNAPERGYLNNSPLNALIDYRNKSYPNMELHLNSFSWDTENTDSLYYINGYSVYSSEEMQCAYILRAYMLLNSMGIDRATLKTFKDTEQDGSGIVRADGTKKIAYGGLEVLTSISKGMYFKEALVNGENNTYVYVFEAEDGKQLIAMWTMTGTAEYTPDASGKLYTYDQASTAYVSTDFTSTALTLTVMPTFITVG